MNSQPAKPSIDTETEEVALKMALEAAKYVGLTYFVYHSVLTIESNTCTAFGSLFLTT